LLPPFFQDRIYALLEAIPEKSLVAAGAHLTNRYRDPSQKAQGFLNAHEALAYTAARLPATFAAVQAVLPHVPFEKVHSVLDMGAGPGTATLAAALHWEHAAQFRLVEGDAFMSAISRQLLEGTPEMGTREFAFDQANLLSLAIENPYDLVILSYVLNELSLIDQGKVLMKAWASTAQGLVIVMPGTPRDYEQLMVVRRLLIEAGAFIAAPCPHHQVCPLSSGDWCHFSTRLARPPFHRKIKDVSLPYEDEKFCYLVALRDPVPRQNMTRVIRKPLHRSGHVTLDLCTADGLQRKTISRRDGEFYKEATKLSWGDPVSLAPVLM
jgi:ribosomal protein RSM22 (predicted rRNA methylase)